MIEQFAFGGRESAPPDDVGRPGLRQYGRGRGGDADHDEGDGDEPHASYSRASRIASSADRWILGWRPSVIPQACGPVPSKAIDHPAPQWAAAVRTLQAWV